MGRTARIDRDMILDAALAIADQHGLEAVTMAAIANRVGVTPMALYRHVANKMAVLDGLVERLLTEFPSPASDAPWAERLGSLAGEIRAMACRHPDVFPLLLQRPAITPEALHVRGGIYRALEEAGVDPERVARTERLISTAILGFATSEVSGRFSHHPPAELDADFERLLEMLGQFIESEANAAGVRDRQPVSQPT